MHNTTRRSQTIMVRNTVLPSTTISNMDMGIIKGICKSLDPLLGR